MSTRHPFSILLHRSVASPTSIQEPWSSIRRFSRCRKSGKPVLDLADESLPNSSESDERCRNN